MVKKLIQKIRKWYEGEYIPYENDPNSSLVFVGGYYKRSLLANMIRAVLVFHSKEWKWVIPVYLTIVGLVVSL